MLMTKDLILARNQQSTTVTSRTTKFSIKKFHFLPTHYIYVFCVDLRTNSGYFIRPGLETLWLEAVIALGIFGPSIHDVIMNSVCMCVYIYIYIITRNMYRSQCVCA